MTFRSEPVSYFHGNNESEDSASEASTDSTMTVLSTSDDEKHMNCTMAHQQEQRQQYQHQQQKARGRRVTKVVSFRDKVRIRRIPSSFAATTPASIHVGSSTDTTSADADVDATSTTDGPSSDPYWTWYTAQDFQTFRSQALEAATRIDNHQPLDEDDTKRGLESWTRKGSKRCHQLKTHAQQRVFQVIVDATDATHTTDVLPQTQMQMQLHHGKATSSSFDYSTSLLVAEAYQPTSQIALVDAQKRAIILQKQVNRYYYEKEEENKDDHNDNIENLKNNNNKNHNHNKHSNDKKHRLDASSSSTDYTVALDIISLSSTSTSTTSTPKLTQRIWKTQKPQQSRKEKISFFSSIRRRKGSSL